MMTIEERKQLIEWLRDKGAVYIRVGELVVSFDAAPIAPMEQEEKPKAEPVDERTGFTEAELFASA